MLEVVKGDKTVKVPEKVLVVGIIAMGACAIVGDFCHMMVKKNK